MLPGRLFDGQTALPHAVVVEAEADGLLLVTAQGTELLPWAQLRRSADGQLIGHTDRHDWRLRLDAPLPADWAARLPQEGRLTGDDRRRIAMAVAGTIGVAAGLWLFGGVILDRLAARLPPQLLAPMGQAMVQGLGPQCTAPAGRAAAQALLARLTPADGAEPITLTIIDSPVVNALALPGGQVVLFRGLIAQAGSADELAGVLAHEIAHVQARDPARALVRHFGLSLLWQALGGSIGGRAEELLALSSTREAEAGADAGAIDLLHGAGIATAPTAAFFDRQRKAAGGKTETGVLATLGGYLSSHPDDGQRSAQFKAANRAGATPALGPAQWQALRSMCKATLQSTPAATRPATPGR